MERLRLDLVYALRTLRRSPGFCTIAALSLALGIGANTAIFSLIHSLLLRPLPVDRPEELVSLTDPNVGFFASETTVHGNVPLLSYPAFLSLREQNQVFAGVAAMASTASDV